MVGSRFLHFDEDMLQAASPPGDEAHAALTSSTDVAEAALTGAASAAGADVAPPSSPVPAPTAESARSQQAHAAPPSSTDGAAAAVAGADAALPASPTLVPAAKPARSLQVPVTPSPSLEVGRSSFLHLDEDMLREASPLREEVKLPVCESCHHLLSPEVLFCRRCGTRSPEADVSLDDMLMAILGRLSSRRLRCVDLFRRFQARGKGLITRAELREGLKTMDFMIPNEELLSLLVNGLGGHDQGHVSVTALDKQLKRVGKLAKAEGRSLEEASTKLGLRLHCPTSRSSRILPSPHEVWSPSSPADGARARSASRSESRRGSPVRARQLGILARLEVMGAASTPVSAEDVTVALEQGKAAGLHARDLVEHCKPYLAGWRREQVRRTVSARDRRAVARAKLRQALTMAQPLTNPRCREIVAPTDGRLRGLRQAVERGRVAGLMPAELKLAEEVFTDLLQLVVCKPPESPARAPTAASPFDAGRLSRELRSWPLAGAEQERTGVDQQLLQPQQQQQQPQPEPPHQLQPPLPPQQLQQLLLPLPERAQPALVLPPEAEAAAEEAALRALGMVLQEAESAAATTSGARGSGRAGRKAGGAAVVGSPAPAGRNGDRRDQRSSSGTPASRSPSAGRDVERRQKEAGARLLELVQVRAASPLRRALEESLTAKNPLSPDVLEEATKLMSKHMRHDQVAVVRANIVSALAQLGVHVASRPQSKSLSQRSVHPGTFQAKKNLQWKAETAGQRERSLERKAEQKMKKEASPSPASRGMTGTAPRAGSPKKASRNRGAESGPAVEEKATPEGSSWAQLCDCGATLVDGAIYCWQCGARRAHHVCACGATSLVPQAAFCWQCGLPYENQVCSCGIRVMPGAVCCWRCGATCDRELCGSCGTIFVAGAVSCWKCGAPRPGRSPALLPASPPTKPLRASSTSTPDVLPSSDRAVQEIRSPSGSTEHVARCMGTLGPDPVTAPPADTLQTAAQPLSGELCELGLRRDVGEDPSEVGAAMRLSNDALEGVDETGKRMEMTPDQPPSAAAVAGVTDEEVAMVRKLQACARGHLVRKRARARRPAIIALSEEDARRLTRLQAIARGRLVRRDADLRRQLQQQRHLRSALAATALVPPTGPADAGGMQTDIVGGSSDDGGGSGMEDHGAVAEAEPEEGGEDGSQGGRGSIWALEGLEESEVW